MDALNPVSSISPRWLSSAAPNRPLPRRRLARPAGTRHDPKSGIRFSERSCSNKKLTGCRSSTTHPAQRERCDPCARDGVTLSVLSGWDVPAVGRPLGGVLPIVGVIFGLGLLAGAILHPPAGTDPFATAARERGAFSWSRYRFAEFNPQATYPAEVLRVIDGDTFEARVRIWSGFEINTRVRLRAIDAPELHARCASEYLKAEAARAALQRILSAGGVTVSMVSLR